MSKRLTRAQENEIIKAYRNRGDQPLAEVAKQFGVTENKLFKLANYVDPNQTTRTTYHVTLTTIDTLNIGPVDIAVNKREIVEAVIRFGPYNVSISTMMKADTDKAVVTLCYPRMSWDNHCCPLDFCQGEDILYRVEQTTRDSHPFAQG